jgi:hypothetical protein
MAAHAQERRPLFDTGRQQLPALVLRRVPRELARLLGERQAAEQALPIATHLPKTAHLRLQHLGLVAPYVLALELHHHVPPIHEFQDEIRVEMAPRYRQ